MPGPALHRSPARAALAAAAAAAYATPASAHGQFASAWMAGAWDPLVVVPLLLAAGAYAGGLRRLWSGAGAGSGIRRWQAAAFAAGWLTLAAALVSPLDRLGAVYFSLHMVQHQLLMLIAAPLIVAGAPLVALLWALPAGWRRAAARLGRRPWPRAGWRWLSRPLAAWSLYALVLWGWHAPVLFEAALASYWLHALQHVTFLAAALLFWWVALHPRGGLAGRGAAMLGLLTTAAHSALLGALLTFAATPWYAPYRGFEAGAALTPLQDQQLAGLIMWVPGGLIHLLAGLALMALAMREAEAQARRRDGRRWAAPLAR